jgi:glycerol-3-phosphate acyltransferase PlsX
MNQAGSDLRPVTVALDAQGADLGVEEVVRGANVALADGLRLRIYGPEREIRAALRDPHGLATVIDAPVAVTNHEEPAAAVRTKRDSSIVLAAKSVATGEADALVSAGPTGATLAASLFNMKRIKGVRRPALAVLIPTGRGGVTVLLDAGANVEVPAENLVQFAALGAEFARWVLNVERPRVGVLSIGEEAGKGTDRVVDAGASLAADSDAPFAYIGNVEGRDIPTDDVDVVVTDGFTGNVALKALEGAGRAVMVAMRDALRSSFLARLGGLLARPRLLRLRDEIDPNTTGGAVMLGLRGVSVVAHGSSNAAGVAAAIKLAQRCAEGGLVEHVTEAIDRGRSETTGGAPDQPAQSAAAVVATASESAVTVAPDDDA